MYRFILLDISRIGQGAQTDAELLLSPTERVRYDRFHHASDAQLFLFGRYLTKQLIALSTKQDPASVTIISDGIAEKPYETNHVVEFSISHSGTYVAVAVAPKPVGIDIQIHDQLDLSIFDAYFKKDEQHYAHQSFDTFYRLWTASESLAKVTGRGLNESLNERRMALSGVINSFTLDDRNYLIYTPLVNEDATLSIATVEPIKLMEHPANDLTTLEQAIVYSAAGSADSAV